MQPTSTIGTSREPVIIRDDQDAQKIATPVIGEQPITTVQTKAQQQHAEAQRDMFYKQATSGICKEGLVKTTDPEEELLTTILESFQDCSTFIETNKDALEEMTVSMALEENEIGETKAGLTSFEGKLSQANRNLFERAVKDARSKMDVAFQAGWYNSLPKAGDALYLAIQKKLANQITQSLEEMTATAPQEPEISDTIRIEIPAAESEILELTDPVKNPVVVIEEPKAREPEVIALLDVPQEGPQAANTVVEQKEPEIVQEVVESEKQPVNPIVVEQEEPKAAEPEPEVVQEVVESEKQPVNPIVMEQEEPKAAEVEAEVIQELIENEAPVLNTTAHLVHDILDNGDVFGNLNAMVRNSAITPVINQNLVKFEASLAPENLQTFKELVQETLGEVKARFKNAFPNSSSAPSVNVNKHLAAIDTLLQGKNFPGIDEMLPVIIKKLVADRFDRDMRKDMASSTVSKAN